MKNPNGYGSVVKLSGNRRRPFVVRKTVGYDDRAYPIYEVIGYFETRKDAMLALANYNSNPYDLKLAKSTFAEVYAAWSKLEYPSMGTSLVSAHKAAYKYCRPLYGKRYSELRKYDMQACINQCGKSYATQSNIRNLLTHLDEFAYDNDIITKCYSQNLTIKEKDVKAVRQIFTDAEVKTLWEHQGEPCIDETLFMLYTGMRASEMLSLTADMVEDGLIRHGMKTAAGKNRVIPVHKELLPVLERHNTSPVFDRWANLEDKSRYNKFKAEFLKKLDGLGMKHNTHDCRHTFRSKLDSAGANKVCIDLLMGHKTADVGERVYTHKTIEELKTAINLLNYNV